MEATTALQIGLKGSTQQSHINFPDPLQKLPKLHVLDPGAPAPTGLDRIMAITNRVMYKFESLPSAKFPSVLRQVCVGCVRCVSPLILFLLNEKGVRVEEERGGAQSESSSEPVSKALQSTSAATHPRSALMNHAKICVE